MKIDTAGSHIEGMQNGIVEPSKSQANALAFMDKEGHWVHVDKNVVSRLYQAMNPPAPKTAPAPIAPAPVFKNPVANSNSPFDDHFKD